MTDFMDRLNSLGIALFVIGWCISSPLGMIYWGAKGWLLGVVLSLILPGFGLLSTAIGLLR